MKNKLRIIGGRWRGRLIDFPEVDGLRPSGNRIRETLFNWLQNTLVDAIALDLFAGSGALGFEALSRGAATVTFVDQNPVIIKQLQSTAKKLSADNISILQEEAPSSSLQKKLSGQQFTLVFLDPPFHKNLIASTCAWLSTLDLLAPRALIYIETECELLPLPLPENWQILKSKLAGQVGYHLIQAP